MARHRDWIELRKRDARHLLKVTILLSCIFHRDLPLLLLGTTEESEEDINWDDDDESESTDANAVSKAEPTGKDDATVKLAASRETLTVNKPPATVTSTSTPATGSPRLSSEDSYDVVSSQVSNAGDNSSKPAEGEEKKGEDDSDDSDWE